MNKLAYVITLLVASALSFYAGQSLSGSEEKNRVDVIEKQISSQAPKSVQASELANVSPQSLAQKNDTQKPQSLDDEEATKSIEQVQAKLKGYEKALRESTARRNATEAKYANAIQRLKEAGLETPDEITKEEVDEVLPEPFSTIVSNSSPNTIKAFKEFNEQEQNYDWAIQMEARISDFFVIHDLAADIKLVSVSCKTNLCEVYGFQNESTSVQKIMRDLRQEDWFKSTGSRSMTGDQIEPDPESGMEGYFLQFYTFAKPN